MAKLISLDEPKKRLGKKLLIVIGFGVLAAVVVGMIAWTFISKNNSSDQPAKPAEDQPLTSYQIADQMAFQGQYDDAQALLKLEAEQEGDKTKKAELYHQQSLLAFNAKKYQEALDLAQKAEATKPSLNTAIMVADTARMLGNKSLAAEYYQKVLDRITPEQRARTPYDYESFEAKLKEMQQ